jgi:FAD/FMN-containing dehydrogenase
VTVSHADTAKPLDLNALSLTRLDEPMRDNAGVRIPTDWVWRTPDLAGAIGAALAQGGSVVMIGAQTSATNNFGRMLRQRPELASPEPVIGIQAQTLNTAPNEPLPQSQEHDFSRPLPSNQLQLLRDREGEGRHTVRLGAGITFSQVNDLVRQELGDDPRWDYCVPIDLTTTDIAHAGAVYATGAQGPSRLRVAEVAKSATLCTGAQLQHLTTPSELAGHQGLWGMTGALIELELRVFRRPKHRFGFFVPLTRSADGSWIEQVAAVLALLRDATTLHLRDGELCSDWPSGLIDGAEVFARDTLELVATTTLPAGPNRIAAQKILQLMQARDRGGPPVPSSDFAIYLTGNAEFADLDEFLSDPTSPLAQLVDYSEHKERFLHAAGIKTIDDERAFEEMRLLRESFADISRQHAKRREPDQAKPFSESTDINCYVDPQAARAMDVEALRAAFRLILQPYYAYEMRIRDLAELGKAVGVQVTLTRYGHLNPRSTNLHTRVTVHAPENAIHAQIYQQVVQRARDNLVNVLKDLGQRNPAIRVEGGEKGKMTPEAWELAGPELRAQTVALLAAADVRLQPHLKGEWAEQVARVRRQSAQPMYPI